MSEIFYQLYEAESSTYTYLIGDSESGEAALIDPVLETFERDLTLVRELKLKLKYVLETHVHADHITSSGMFRNQTGALVGLSDQAQVECADLALADGEELSLGKFKIKVIHTPGHTDSCASFLFEGRAFTGDALLIRGCGRTDFQQGSSDKLFKSVREKLFSLPKETKVYPAHDYKGRTSSTIAEEREFNPRLKLENTLQDFKKIMSELKLDPPKKIKESVPANMRCGNLGPIHES